MLVMPDGAQSAQRIVVVEEDESAALLARILGAAGYEEVRTASSAGVVDVLLDRWEPDLVVLDLEVPDIDGFELLTKIVSTGVPVLVLTDDNTPTTRRRALGLGARDFVTKPLDRVEALLRVGNLLQTRRLQRALEDRNHDLQRWVRARTADLEDARRETLERLARAAEYRDDDTSQHTKRVGRTAALLARQLGLASDTIEHLRYAAPLHDVGKIGIPDAVWLKPGALSEHERRMLEEHTEIGGRILSGSRSPILRLAEQIARTHHERWDGSGYPEGIADEQIHQFARIAAVADVYDAVTSERVYRPPMKPHEGVAIINQGEGADFDPEVVAVFSRVVMPFPPGSEVELADGRIGLVVDVDPRCPYEPTVRVRQGGSIVEIERALLAVPVAV